MNLLHPTYCARSTVVNKTKSWISQSIYSSWGACVCLVTQSCPVLCNTMNCSPSGSSVHGDPPGKNTEVGCHALLQGIFPNQGLKPSLLHCRRILYCLDHQGSPHNISLKLYHHIHSSIIHSSQKVETTLVPISNEWVNRMCIYIQRNIV